MILINDNIFVIKFGENGYTSVKGPTVLCNLNVDIFHCHSKFVFNSVCKLEKLAPHKNEPMS